MWSLVSKRFEYKRSLNRGLLILFVFENWCWVTAKFIHSFRKLDVIFEKTQKPCRSCNLASYSYGQGPSNNKPYWNYHQKPKLTINQPLKLTKTCLTLFKWFKLIFNRWSVQRNIEKFLLILYFRLNWSFWWKFLNARCWTYQKPYFRWHNLTWNFELKFFKLEKFIFSKTQKLGRSMRLFMRNTLPT